MNNKLDELLALIGTGWWDVIHYVVLIFCLGLPASQALGGAFLAPNVDYTCLPTLPESSSATDILGSHQNPYNARSLELYQNNSFQSQCKYFVKDVNTSFITEEACTVWEFDNSTFASTITSEFQLTCDRSYFRATYQSIYMVGMLIGALVSGIAADRYGRKRTLITGMLSFVVITNVVSFVPNLTGLLFLRFMLGISVPFIANICYILVVEISEPRLRPHMGIVSMLPWAFGTMILGGVACLIRSWRWLQMAVSLPGLLVLPVLWFMDESPRWLAVTGQLDRGVQVLKKAARLNRANLPSDMELIEILNECKDNQEDPTKEKLEARGLKTILKEKLNDMNILFRTPKLRRITISLYVAYLLVNMIYYGLSLSGGNLSDNPFIFMTLSGLMEVPAYSLTVPIVARFGRRLPTLVSFAISGIVLLAIAPTPSSCGWVIMTLAMVGKVTITSAYQILIFYSTELFPTEVRSRGIGTSFMMSRFGSIISPFINEILGSAYPWAPAAVFGVTSIIACLVMLTLPETMGTALPDTVADLEARETEEKNRSWNPVPTSEKPIESKQVQCN